MWTKRPESEIRDILARQERRRKSPLRPLIYGIFWATIWTTIYGLGYRGGLSRGVLMYSDPRFDRRLLGLGIIATLVIMAIVYYRQLRGIKFFDLDSDALLCTGCFEPASPSPTNTCECGVRLEPYEFYEWNEPESTETQPSIA
ncbi:MAG: hypothetical protein ABL984_09805 [Pyrinomonadaceae bacterium]